MNGPALPLGTFDDIAIDVYHASAGISNSGLSDFARSPRHYHALHLNPDRPAEGPTTAQLEGQLAHCAILEPAAFDTRYVIGPNTRRGTKVWDAFEASLTSEQIGIKPDQAEVAKAQALSVRSIPDVAALLAKGKPEVSAFWIDPATGELCRCRPDWVHPAGDGGVILVDVKTCGDAGPRQFARQVARMGYQRQAAYYSEGYEHASGKRVLGFVFVAVETEWPFAAGAYMLDDESLAKGRAENTELLSRFAMCRSADHWPAWGDAISLISLPAWALSTTTESEP